MRKSKLNLDKLSYDELYNLADFIVSENYKHHGEKGTSSKSKQEEIRSIYREERNFFKNSLTYVSRNNHNELIGTIRTLRWNFIDQLPIQKLFGINPFSYCKDENTSIWSIGRFAITKEATNSFLLFKQLLVCTLLPIVRDENSIVFIECDSKLLRILNLLGIKTQTIGKSINYLGSETIPVCISYDGFIEFFRKNRFLVSDKLERNDSILHKSVVSSFLDSYYTFV